MGINFTKMCLGDCIYKDVLGESPVIKLGTFLSKESVLQQAGVCLVLGVCTAAPLPVLIQADQSEEMQIAGAGTDEYCCY